MVCYKSNARGYQYSKGHKIYLRAVSIGTQVPLLAVLALLKNLTVECINSAKLD